MTDIAGGKVIGVGWIIISMDLKDENPCITFHMNGECLLTIKTDGTIERGPRFTTNEEASIEFWHTLAGYFPLFLDRATNRRLRAPWRDPTEPLAQRRKK